MTRCYFQVGGTLATLTNIEHIIPYPPSVNPQQGGALMPLMGQVGRRLLSNRLQRNGRQDAAWMFDDFLNDYTDLLSLQYALYGDLVTSSKQLCVVTVDSTNHYSPFLCDVDNAYPGQSLNSFNDQPYAARFDLIGGTLQSVTKSANATLTTSERYVLVDTSAGNVTITLAPANSPNADTTVNLIKTAAAHSLIYQRNGSDTLNGATSTQSINSLNGRVDLVSDGVSNWNTF